MDKQLIELAAKLTKPQRRVVLSLSEEAQVARRGEWSPVAAFNLVPEIAQLGFDRRSLRETYRLTTHGLRLQATLRAIASKETQSASQLPTHKEQGE